MSLKGFHIFFIALAILCTFGFAAWALLMPPQAGVGGGVRGMGILSGVLGVVLVFYGIWFAAVKARKLIV